MCFHGLSTEIRPVNSFGKSLSIHSRCWYVPESRTIMNNTNDSMRFCNVKLCVSVKFCNTLLTTLYIIISSCSELLFILREKMSYYSSVRSLLNKFIFFMI